MKGHTLPALAVVISILSACGVSDKATQEPKVEAAIPAATPHSIVLNSGQVISIPEGVDILKSGWAYQNLTAAEATQVAAACEREQKRQLKANGSPDLPKPLLWVCRQSAAGPENFSKR